MDDQPRRGRPHPVEYISWLVAIFGCFFGVFVWIYDRVSDRQEPRPGFTEPGNSPPQASPATKSDPIIDVPIDRGVAKDSSPIDIAIYGARMPGKWVLKQQDCPETDGGAEAQENVAWQQFYIRDGYLIIDPAT